MNKNILEFIRNIRTKNAKVALENLRSIVSNKVKQRKNKIQADI